MQFSAIANLERFDVAKVYEGALDIMERIGVEVDNDEVMRRTAGKLPVSGNRLMIPREITGSFLDEYRAKTWRAPDANSDYRLSDNPLIIRTSPLNHCWADPKDGKLKEFNTETAIDNTKLLQKFVRSGLVIGDIAGIPQDVPGGMQYMMAQYLRCVYTPNPCSWGIFPSEAILKVCLEMGEIMEFPTGILMEMISPMKLVGQSLDLTMKYHREMAWVVNDPMPILGVTAPADWHMAWSQSVAENLAGYIIMRMCGVERIGIGSFRLFVPSPATAMTYFSSPKHVAALLSRRKLRWELLGERVDGGELLLVTSKVPDIQAAAEKMAGMAFARANGFYELEGAGGLFMDEIFSPEQLVIDIELANFVNNSSVDFSPTAQDVTEVVAQGVADGGYLASPMSLERYYDFAWKPKLFDIRTRSSWEDAPKSILEKARAALDAMDSQPCYELEGQKREKLEVVLGRIKKEHGCA